MLCHEPLTSGAFGVVPPKLYLGSAGFPPGILAFWSIK